MVRRHTGDVDYQHMQRGYTAIPVLVLFVVISVPIVVADDESTVAVAMIVGLMVAILAVVVLFSFLEVTVRDGTVASAFGFGWPARVIDLANVTAVRQVRNPWWHGWGIRKVPGGWVYNVWGLDAVELDLADSKVFRIGTDEPEMLFGVLSLNLTP
jgi:hypothetical protein